MGDLAGSHGRTRPLGYAPCVHTQARSRERMASVDPATREVIGSVPIAAAAAVVEAVGHARGAQREWARASLRERGAVLRRVADAILERQEDIAALVTRENGKPLTEAYTAEVMGSISILRWLAANVEDALGDEPVAIRQTWALTKRGTIQYRPVGVVGVIAPWNYPLVIALSQTAYAVAAGNGVVVKPSEETPLVGQLVDELFATAGVPRGLVSVVQGGAATGEAVVASVDRVLFTGSTAVGRSVGEACARRLIGCVLELGGKDPLVVFADADLDRAVDGAVWAAFMNAGQMCVSVERILVEDPIAQTFATRLAERAGALTVGDGRTPGTDVGPIVNDAQFARVAGLVEDAVARGGRVLTGGTAVEVPGLAGRFFAPTVLVDVPASARINDEEIFGPVVTVTSFRDERDAVEQANDSRYGLGASVRTSDQERAARVARQLRAGQVWTNDHTYSFAVGQAPWGGVKDSGLGRSHGRHGLVECSEVVFVDADRGRLRQPWWMPYRDGAPDMFRTVTEVLYSPTLARRVRAALTGRRHLIRLARSYFKP